MPFVVRNACDGRQKVWAHVLVDHDGQGHRACHQGAKINKSKENEIEFYFPKIFLAKKDFVPIPAAELYEHVDSEADVTVEQSEVVAMGILRNVRQFHKFEQMVGNTFREPVDGNQSQVKCHLKPIDSVIYLAL